MTRPIFISISFLFFIFTSTLLAQGNRGGNQPNNANKVQAIIKGKIVDATEKTPLEYATITLLNASKEIITGTITDKVGGFVLETKPGLYTAQIEFISYQTQTISTIEVTEAKPFLNLGTIDLQPDAENLTQIEVRAEKSEFQLSLDKKVFNVGKDLANNGGTAEDILDNVPAVTVDVEGNVSMRGSQNVRILINGKPSGMVGSSDANGLRQLPSNMIEKVEVITNPSARYEAEGMAGIINIVLKKEQKQGVNGSFDFTVGWPHNHGIAVNLNYRKKWVNLFVNYGVYYRKHPGGGFLYQESYQEDTTFILDQQRTHLRGGLSNSIRFGSDFFITPKQTLTAAFLYKKAWEDNVANIDYYDYINNFPENLISKTYRTDDEYEREADLEYSLKYKKEFLREKQELVIDVRYEENSEAEGSELLEKIFNSDDSPSGIPDIKQRSENEEGQRTWSIQADYIHPLGKDHQFETGYRSTFRNIQNDYLVEEEGAMGWESLPGLSNNFNYQENIYALYAVYGNKYGKFSYQAGLRGEYSDVRTELVQTAEINDRQYFDLFPSLHLNYELPKNHAIQLSYSRRITRPRFWFLNPFFTFSDSRNFFSGNPDLDPEYTHSIEFSHVKYWEKASLSSSVYYRHTNGVIERIRQVFDDGTSKTQPENLLTEDAFGIEFTTSYSPTKWWKISGDFNFFRAIKDGGNLGAEFRADAYSWSTNITSRKTVWKDLDIQLRLNYNAPSASTQGIRKSRSALDFGASKDLFKKKATLTFSISDVFNTRKRRYSASGTNFFSEGEWQWRPRVFKLTLNYRLNQKKQRGGRGGGFGGGGDF